MSNLKQPTGATNQPSAAGRDMHREVEWIAPADPYILEFMMSCSPMQGRTKLSPKSIALNVPYGRKHVGNRCRDLADHGLLERTERGVYRLTDRGEAFANGELSATDLLDPKLTDE